MSIQIRKIEEKDIKGFYDALCAVAREGIYLLTTTPPPFDKMERFVRNNIQNNHAQYVAVLNNDVIGWADIVPLERETMNHSGHLGMGVLTDFRGKGVGTQLLQQTIKHAWKQKLTRLELEVFSDNPVAIKLYERNNFEVEGVKKCARLFENNYQDIIVMAQIKAEHT